MRNIIGELPQPMIAERSNVSPRYPSDNAAIHIDAYRFMEKLIESGKDLLMIIEAYLPTRFHEKTYLSTLVKARGNAVAIYASGHPGQQTDDLRMEGHFTEKILDKFASLMFFDELVMKKWSTKGWSIPELLRGEEDMHNNPYNMELMHPTNSETLEKMIDSEGDDSIIYRILCDKHRIGFEQKLMFCRDTIEDTKRERQLKINRENRYVPADQQMCGRVSYADHHSLRKEGFAKVRGADVDALPTPAICAGEPTRK